MIHWEETKSEIFSSLRVGWLEFTIVLQSNRERRGKRFARMQKKKTTRWSLAIQTHHYSRLRMSCRSVLCYDSLFFFALVVIPGEGTAWDSVAPIYRLVVLGLACWHDQVLATLWITTSKRCHPIEVFDANGTQRGFEYSFAALNGRNHRSGSATQGCDLHH